MFIRKYLDTGSIGRRVGSGRRSKVTVEVKELVEEQMRRDDETTAHQLHQLLHHALHHPQVSNRIGMELSW